MVSFEEGGLLKKGEEAYLTSETLVYFDVTIGTVKGLLEKGEKDGDDDDCLETLSEDDEEDGNREYVDSHDGRVGWKKEEEFNRRERKKEHLNLSDHLPRFSYVLSSLFHQSQQAMYPSRGSTELSRWYLYMSSTSTIPRYKEVERYPRGGGGGGGGGGRDSSCLA